MRLARVLGEGETVSAEAASNALTALNDMLDSWNTERLAVYQVRKESLTLTPGSASYTIGSGGNLNTTRPVKIEAAWITRQGIDYPLTEINSFQYDSIPLKTSQASFSELFWYDTGYPLGTIYIFPVPTEANTLNIRTWVPLNAGLALSDTISLPPGYRRALAFSLAEEIAPEYGVQLLPDVKAKAAKARDDIRQRNAVMRVMSIDSTIANVRAGGYNIFIE